jgi:hypothetical protein
MVGKDCTTRILDGLIEASPGNWHGGASNMSEANSRPISRRTDEADLLADSHSIM